MSADGDLLVIENLSVDAVSSVGRQTILDRVNLRVPRGGITGVVGGSGSGKSTTALAILGLLPVALNVFSGRIFFEGMDLLALPQQQWRSLRGKAIGMVFQEPLYAFNPLFTIGHQVEEVLLSHTDMSGAKRKNRVVELLDMAGIKDPSRVAQLFPHQLSGGMRQRAMIAQAIAGQPRLLIADEPTSNLDVTTQAKIMDLFTKLCRELDLTILLISHDLGMVAHLAQQAVVMCQGQVVEADLVTSLMASPQHAYTRQLVDVFR